MRELIAGEGGSVLAVAARSPDAVALACEGLGPRTSVPSGLPVFDTADVPDDLEIDALRITACEPATRAALIAWAERRGIRWEEAAPVMRAKPDGIRIVCVSAESTGSGKTALTRRVARTLARSGVSVAVVRHPLPSLLHWNRFDVSVIRSPDEVRAPRPVDEREELAPVVGTGVAVATGLDPDRVLAAAAREAGPDGVVVWDGGGAATPWVECDLHLVCVDCLRPPDQLRDADVYVLTKADTAGERARATESHVRARKPDATVLLADLAIGVQPTQVLQDKRVVIVEDAPSLMLGRLQAGAGAIAAKRFRCGVVDPRPFAVGAIADALRTYTNIGPVIPSLGRTPGEISDLGASVLATPGDAILWASNADPVTVIADEHRPVVRAYGELTEVAGPGLQEILTPLL